MTLSEKDYSKLGDLEKAKRYQRINHRLYFLGLALTGTLLAILTFSPLGTWFRDAVSGFQDPFLQLQVYFILFSLFFLIFDLPLSFYSGYMVEKRFELTNHTLGSWALDELKKAALSFVIASLLIQIFYFCIRTFPEHWWWIAWAAYFLFTIFFTKIVPLWIVPLFYKYGPIESETLKERIRKMGEAAGLQIKNFFSLNLSRTTKKANAMFAGLGKSKRVVLADTLLQNFSEDEIAVVLAHEIGHYKKKHILKGIALGAVFSLALFYLAYLFLNFRSQTLGLFPQDPFFFPGLALFLWAIATVSDPFFKAISRKHEREADRYALETSRDREAFISAFEKLAAQNLADPNPSPWIEKLLYSHPSIGKRIEFAKNFQL
jgi:STE24 endopeptidase